MRSSRLYRRGAIKAVAALFAVATVAFVAAETTPSAQKSLFAPSPEMLKTALSRLSLDPNMLAAAGASGPEVGGVVARMKEHLESGGLKLAAAEESFSTAQREYDRLKAIVQAGVATGEDVAAWKLAQSTLDSTRATRRKLQDEAFASATAGMPHARVQAIDIARANAEMWDVPEAYRFERRSEEDWVSLRHAIASRDASIRLGQEVNPAVQQVLGLIDAQRATAAASASLQTNLPTVMAAWNEALSK